MSRASTIELLADYKPAEPLGIEDTEATDDIAQRDGKLPLGPLAIGDPKLKVHKACGGACSRATTSARHRRRLTPSPKSF